MDLHVPDQPIRRQQKRDRSRILKLRRERTATLCTTVATADGRRRYCWGRSHLVMFSNLGSPHRSIIQNGPSWFCVPMVCRKPDGFGAATEGNVATQMLTLLTVTILFKMERTELLRALR